MKEAEEREGGRERGRGGDADLLERGGRAFFRDSVKKKNQLGQKHTTTEIMKDILKFMLNTKSLSR